MRKLVLVLTAVVGLAGTWACCTAIGGQKACVVLPTPTPAPTVVPTQAPTSAPTPTPEPSETPFPSATATPVPTSGSPTPTNTPVAVWPPTIDMTSAGQPVHSGQGMEITQHYVVRPAKVNPVVLPEMPDPGNPANANFWANIFDGKQSARNCDADHYFDPTGKPTVMFYICGGSVKFGWKPRDFDVARAGQSFEISCTAPSKVDKYPARDFYQAVVSGPGGSCTVCLPIKATTGDGILMPVAVACFTRPVV